MNDLELAIAAARAGGAVVARHFGASPPARMKALNDPVTAVDRESELVIVDLISTQRPDDTIVAEEGGGRAGSERRWLIDPLDGTVNFVHAIPQVAVSVALYDGDEPVVAAVLDPIREETFTAAAGQGARCNGSDIAVSDATGLAGTVIATGFPYDHDRHADGYARTVGAVLREVNGIRRFGSAALDLAWTAAGRFDGYWELGVAPWDVAAGIILVREAGGVVTDPFDRRATPETPLIVAAGAGAHPALTAVVRSALPEHLDPA